MDNSSGVRSRIQTILDMEIDRLLQKSANSLDGLSLNDTKKLDLLIKAHQSFQLPDDPEQTNPIETISESDLAKLLAT